MLNQLKLKIMKAIKINNFPKSLVSVLVENDITFAYNWGNVIAMGTSSIDKLKARLMKIGVAPSDVELLSCEVIELNSASEVYDF